MDKPDLYSTENVYKELEKREFILPEVPDSILFRAQQLLLDACTYENGLWISGNPFVDLETILAILRDDIEHAEQFLEPPERAREIKRALQLEDVFKAIRDQLEARFREPGRE